ncbi:unnamed protein product [Prorocentrum cordatum]|uniref:Beta-galactosidase n=1 Tax=Prorocentrum cordatum TaxID=2364126 RepID=A0ABN9PVG9_9DINO|nr:unnamed protein product [Polarella glacialis]
MMMIVADGGGCATQAERGASPYSSVLSRLPIQGPAECGCGYYFMDGTSVYQQRTNGAARRRRSEASSDCPADKEDVGDFDNCISGAWLTEPLAVNKYIHESGILLQGRMGHHVDARPWLLRESAYHRQGWFQ